MLLGGTLLVGEGLELVHQPLGMDPAQRVLADVELPGIVADDDRLAQEAVRLTAPHSAPSVATRTGSGVTCRPVMPSCSRCALQAGSSANCRCSCAASCWTTGPARACSRI